MEGDLRTAVLADSFVASSSRSTSIISVLALSTSGGSVDSTSSATGFAESSALMSSSFSSPTPPHHLEVLASEGLMS